MVLRREEAAHVLRDFQEGLPLVGSDAELHLVEAAHRGHLGSLERVADELGDHVLQARGVAAAQWVVVRA